MHEDAEARIRANFYKGVAQSVLLYGCETWVISPAVQRALSGFHHRVARRLSGRTPRYLRQEDRWVYPPIAEALEVAGMFTMEHYVSIRQNTLVNNITTRPILELCREAERRTGSPSRLYWWTQPGPPSSNHTN